jgi:hypothetical protein
MFCIGLAMFATRTTPRVRAGVKLRNAPGFGFSFCLWSSFLKNSLVKKASPERDRDAKEPLERCVVLRE